MTKVFEQIEALRFIDRPRVVVLTADQAARFKAEMEAAACSFQRAPSGHRPAALAPTSYTGAAVRLGGTGHEEIAGARHLGMYAGLTLVQEAPC